MTAAQGRPKDEFTTFRPDPEIEPNPDAPPLRVRKRAHGYRVQNLHPVTGEWNTWSPGAYETLEEAEAHYGRVLASYPERRFRLIRETTTYEVVKDCG